MCKFFAQDPKNSAVSDVNIKDSFFGRDENQKKKRVGPKIFCLQERIFSANCDFSLCLFSGLCENFGVSLKNLLFQIRPLVLWWCLSRILYYRLSVVGFYVLSLGLHCVLQWG